MKGRKERMHKKEINDQGRRSGRNQRMKERKKERLKEQNKVSNIYKEEECDVTLLW